MKFPTHAGRHAIGPGALDHYAMRKRNWAERLAGFFAAKEDTRKAFGHAIPWRWVGVTHERSGKPTIRGMRITVYDVLDYLASGMTTDEILKDFPYLTREDIQACLSFAADRERRVTVVAE